MKNTLKIVFYAIMGNLLLGLSTIVNAAPGITDPNAAFGKNRVITPGEGQTLDVAVQGYISNFMVFLTIIAVMYALWGGFNILTAGGDEEKVKKGKTVLIQVFIGLLVIWISGSVVNWAIGIIAGTA